MKRDNNILEELSEISALFNEIQRTNLYYVASGYFNQFPSLIISKIILAEEPVYYFSPVTPFNVPVNYFEDLPFHTLYKTLSENNRKEVFDETEQIAPLLNTISKDSTYSIPEDFFKKLLKPASPKAEAKVVFFKNVKKINRLLVAAAIFALIFIGIFLIKGNDIMHVGSQASNTPAEVKNLSEDEIVWFLKTNSLTENVTSASLNILPKESEINNSLKKMTDQEIQQFLQETREPGGI